MTRQSAKGRERAALAHLLANTDLGVEMQSIEPREAPDFILTLNDGTKVGVEVVELANREVAAGMAGYKRFKSALLAALAHERINVTVHTSTRDGFIPSFNDKSAVESHVAAMVALAGEHFGSGRETSQYDRDRVVAAGASLLIKVRIDSSGAPEVLTGARVMSFGLGSFVADRVKEKEQKLAAYRAAVDGPIWLLLVAGARFASGIWSKTVEERELATEFDRVFYVDGYDSAAFEVTVVARESVENEGE